MATQYIVKVPTASEVDPRQYLGEIELFNADQTPASVVTAQPPIADLAAAPTAADFNGLLAALRAAGVLQT